MPLVTLRTTTTNLTRETKAQVVSEFTETLVRVLGKKPENVHIVIDVVDDENWGHSGKLVAETRKIARD
jgi:4-oxalocrotonate tautomerase